MFNTLTNYLRQSGSRASSWRQTRVWMDDRKSAVALSLLRLIALAQREQLDLVPLVDNLSREHRRMARHRLRRLSRLLASGTSLTDALEQTPGLLDDETLLSLRFASQSGTLGSTYDELIERAACRSFKSINIVHKSLGYAAALAFVFTLILIFLMTFIAPTFKSIVADEFGMQLPNGLQWLLQLSAGLANNYPLVILIVGITVAILWFYQPIRTVRRWLASRVFPSVAQLRRSHLLRMLAQTSEAGRPIPGSLSTLARYHFDHDVRAKLLFARNEVEQGADVWQSLRESKLVSDAEATAFGSSTSAGLRSWLMRRLADQKERAVEQRNLTCAMLVHPAVILVFGAITLFVTQAFLSVLISLITWLS